MTKDRFLVLTKKLVKLTGAFLAGASLATVVVLLVFYLIFEQGFRDQVYPGVFVGSDKLSGQTREEVLSYFSNLNRDFGDVVVNFSYKDATSGAERNWSATGLTLGIGLDVQNSTEQVFGVGRSGDFINDLFAKWKGIRGEITLKPVYRFSELSFNTFIDGVGAEIESLPQDALFRFEDGRAVSFKLSTNGQKIDREETKRILSDRIAEILQDIKYNEPSGRQISIVLPVVTVKPKIESEKVNNMGIKELIGTGNSFFYDSIPERMFNIELAASRVNGVMVAPGETFSFGEKIGTISASTGYKKAMAIIKGKTVLDDGGGVCQVSTTVYRAALNAGFPIIERTAHYYRVSFYEQGGFMPGIDATVYPPDPDLKFQNDTQNWILLQAIVDMPSRKLTFDIYGTSDGRKTEMTKPVILSTSPPPAPIYNDDPNLQKGVVKQIDTAHAGAKVYFTRKVIRGDEILIDESVYSDYRPWPAVYLRGIRE